MMFRVQGAGFRVVRAVLEVVAIAGLIGSGARMPVSATQTSDGEALYDGACAMCHDAPSSTSRAPGKDALRGRSPEAIVDSLTGGAMRYQGLSLSGAERRAIAVFLTGKAFGGDIAGATFGRCTTLPAFTDPAAGVSWNGWSPTLENTHFQPPTRAGLTADQIPGLRLKWAFGFPDATSAWAQPTVAGGRLFVGSQNGTVYSLDPRTGCIIWTFTAQGSVRASISVSRTGAYFSDQKGYAYALDPTSGKLLWSRKVDNHPLIRLTGSPSLYEGTLYVPTSSYEEAGKSPSYACCTFRGSVVALDAATGSERWRSYTIAEEPKPMRRLEGSESPGESIAWGPAGGAIWSSPTIDPKRGALYVGVGNTYAGLVTQPAANAVVAFALETGKMLWAKQVSAPDIFGCRAGAANCGERPGPDFDFGSSPALVRLASGRELIVIGSKSGIGYAMDPDKQGEIVWQYRAGKGSALGGIMWGAAVDGEQAYFPVADGNSPEPGGLHAVKLATGERAWFAPPRPLKCGARGRGCNGAQSAALTAIAGVVFSPSNDGAIRAFSTKDGTMVWEFDTNRDFETVNRIKARGGSMNGPAPVVVGGMVYVNSGYGAFGSRTGNVLLAFGVE
jgi:polyvinyl alcohol dehydrogenase (cytochrome)